jgi:hypothetical protein
VHFEMEGRAGEASRWNTLRALRVLRWVSAPRAHMAFIDADRLRGRHVLR